MLPIWFKPNHLDELTKKKSNKRKLTTKFHLMITRQSEINHIKISTHIEYRKHATRHCKLYKLHWFESSYHQREVKTSFTEDIMTVQ